MCQIRKSACNCCFEIKFRGIQWLNSSLWSGGGAVGGFVWWQIPFWRKGKCSSLEEPSARHVELFPRHSRSCAGSLLTEPDRSLCVRCVLGEGISDFPSLAHMFCFSFQFNCAYSIRLQHERELTGWKLKSDNTFEREIGHMCFQRNRVKAPVRPWRQLLFLQENMSCSLIRGHMDVLGDTEAEIRCFDNSSPLTFFFPSFSFLSKKTTECWS